MDEAHDLGQRLDDDTMDRYDPQSHGWEKYHGPYRGLFPEVMDRRMVWEREFWVRRDERLVLEWVAPCTIKVVFLNGRRIAPPFTPEGFDVVWMRPESRARDAAMERQEEGTA